MKSLFLLTFLASAYLLNGQDMVQFKLDVAEVTQTQKVYNFTVDDFNDVIAWQYTMQFDGSKMVFKEIRNSLIEDLNTSTFYEPYPGNLFSSWIDLDFVPTDFPDATVVFQMVFDLYETDGSTLCLSTTPQEYEIVKYDPQSEDEFLVAQLMIDDECSHELVLNLTNSTSVGGPLSNAPAMIENVYLSTNGELAFTSIGDQLMALRIYDIMGNEMVQLPKNNYAKGRIAIDTPVDYTEGVYILTIEGVNQLRQTYRVFAK